jgi:hypothetical protein
MQQKQRQRYRLAGGLVGLGWVFIGALALWLGFLPRTGAIAIVALGGLAAVLLLNNARAVSRNARRPV